MKKLLIVLAALSLAHHPSVTPKGELVSIDSILIMQKSKEGQDIAVKLQKEIEQFQNQVKVSHGELTNLQDEITKQAKVLSTEALQAKTDKLTQMKKDAERTLTDKEESLKAAIQRKQFALREKQLSVISEVSEKNEWGVLVDKNTPGVLFVSNAIDKTDIVLQAIDAKYEASTEKKAPAKKSTLTAKNSSTPTIDTSKKVA